MVEDANGSVWFAKVRGGPNALPVCRVDARDVQCHGPPDIPFRFASVLGRADHDAFWIGSSTGLCRWVPGQAAQCFFEQAMHPLAGLQGVTAVTTSRDGTVWVGIGKAGPDFGLGRLVDGRWRPFAAKGLDGSSLVVATLLEARDGSLWIGTADRGVYRIHGDDVDHFGAEHGLSGNTVSPGGLLEDVEGTVWVATATGVDSFRRLPVSVFSTREGLEADSVESILAARDGTVWIGNLSLSTIVGNRVTPPPMASFFRGKDVTSMLRITPDGSGSGSNTRCTCCATVRSSRSPRPTAGRSGLSRRSPRTARTTSGHGPSDPRPASSASATSSSSTNTAIGWATSSVCRRTRCEGSGPGDATDRSSMSKRVRCGRSPTGPPAAQESTRSSPRRTARSSARPAAACG